MTEPVLGGETRDRLEAIRKHREWAVAGLGMMELGRGEQVGGNFDYGAARVQACIEEDVPWLLGEVSRLRERIAAFVAKYDVCSPAMDAAFVFKAIHGSPYSGPNWKAELDALRASVPSVEGSPTGLGGSEPDAP